MIYGDNPQETTEELKIQLDVTWERLKILLQENTRLKRQNAKLKNQIEALRFTSESSEELLKAEPS